MSIHTDGNSVKIGNGPAAVILTFSVNGKRTFSVICVTGFIPGRPLKKKESQKTCLSNVAATSWTEACSDLPDKKGISPDRVIIGPGIFVFRARFNFLDWRT